MRFLLAEAAKFEYVPFKTGMVLGNYWILLAFPLCLAIAIVYKSIRCESMDRLPREAGKLFVFIVAFMVAAAGVLFGIVHLLER